MFDTTNQAVIFVPMLVVVALTFVAFVRMAMARGKVAGQMDPEFYRAQLGGHEPEVAVVAVRHWGNLFELPTLFYAGCLTAYVLQAVSGVLLGFAWAYVAARLVQSAVHLTYNKPTHRGLAFVVGVLCMVGLWVKVGIAVCATL